MASRERVFVPRAQRFPFHIPLQYRKNDHEDWHSCRTMNISRTGILFRSDEALPVNSTLDIRVRFPMKMILSCQGSVVRSQESAHAVRIRHYRLQR